MAEMAGDNKKGFFVRQYVGKDYSKDSTVSYFSYRISTNPSWTIVQITSCDVFMPGILSPYNTVIALGKSYKSDTSETQVYQGQKPIADNAFS